MDITADTILDGADYDVRFEGNRYEISPDFWIRLKTPTAGLRRKAALRADELKDEDDGDYRLLHLIADPRNEGEWPKIDDCVPELVTAAVWDFFLALRKMLERQSTSLEAFGPSPTTEAKSEKQDGSDRGEQPSETGGET